MVEIDKKYCMTFDESDNIYITYIGSCPYNGLLFLNQEIAGYGKKFNSVHVPQNALELMITTLYAISAILLNVPVV